MEYLRICNICGEQFVSKSAKKLICYKNHMRICPDCGKQVIWNKLDEFHGCKSCNQKHAVIKRKSTMLERYGGETTMQSKMLSDKVKSTIIEKYGVDNIRKNRDIQKKSEDTCLIKYGVKNPMQNKDIAKKSAKIRSINIESTMEHIKNTFLEKYGVENISQSPEIIEKITNTFLNKYGVTRAAQVPEFQKKMRDTTRERYGVDYYVTSEEYRKNAYFRKSKINEQFENLLISLNTKITSTEYRIDLKCYDIFIKDSNTLVEINPTYTHNIIGNHWNKNGLDKYYHRDKTQLAIDNGYKCIHIWDWDNKEIIARMLAPKIHMSCDEFQLYKLNLDVVNEFLDKNHYIGKCRGQLLCIGLVKDDEIYQVMTFGKPKFDKSHAVQLYRMCTKLGYEIDGGYDRLSRFASEFGLYDIVAYADFSKTDGSEYEKLGMKFKRQTQPRLIWSKDSMYINSSLIVSGRSKYHTDEELIKDGWLPVYDCGQRVYVFK